jgi:hypothetical protein
MMNLKPRFLLRKLLITQFVA